MIICALLFLEVAVFYMLNKFFIYLVDNMMIDWYIKRISDMFVVRRNCICQLNSAAAKRQAKIWKKVYKNNFIELIPFVSSYLNEELIKAVHSEKLTRDQIYTAHTHLIRRFTKAERKGYLHIISIKPCKFKKLLLEARLFIPTVEILKNITYYTRRFYIIKFKVIRKD